MKALIVEDDSVARKLLERLLRSRGHDVQTFQDGESAWEVYQKEAFPLVLLDWRLPGMDGLQLCRRMRKCPHGKSSHILVITGKNKAGDLQKVLKAGADDYLMKPIDTKRLDIRLSIAEQQVVNLAKKHKAEAELEKTLCELEQSHNDLLAILNRLRLGTAMTDEKGKMTFLSLSAQHILNLDGDKVYGKEWYQVLPLRSSDLKQLQEMIRQPEKNRQRILVQVLLAGGGHWLEIEVKDDPRDPRRKIFVLYDVSEVHDLRRQLEEKARFQDMIGKSEPMQAVYQLIRDLAAVDTTVLIDGETGTGKELVASAIHHLSNRVDKPFIAVNCAGLTESLIASQLFGHKKGAFTGAVQDHQGLFEAATGGTLFLDEIGDFPISIQSNLLRVLENREITRVGENKPRKVDVRVLSATNHNLEELVEERHFRRDLLYRVRVARIQVPALRERQEDIPLLVDWLLRQTRARLGKNVENVSQEALRALMGHDWPGNVRELRNAIEFAAIRCKGSAIQREDLPQEILGSERSIMVGDAGDDREALLMALKQSGGNRSAAAKLLGISRATLYRRLAEHHVGEE